jgi:hypothetical protein
MPPIDSATLINLTVHVLFATAAFVAMALAFRGSGLNQDHVTLRIRAVPLGGIRLTSVISITAGLGIICVSTVEHLTRSDSLIQNPTALEFISSSLLVLSGITMIFRWHRAYPLYLTSLGLLMMNILLGMIIGTPPERTPVDVISIAAAVALIFTGGIAYSAIYFQTMARR